MLKLAISFTPQRAPGHLKEFGLPLFAKSPHLTLNQTLSSYALKALPNNRDNTRKKKITKIRICYLKRIFNSKKNCSHLTFNLFHHEPTYEIIYCQFNDKRLIWLRRQIRYSDRIEGAREISSLHIKSLCVRKDIALSGIIIL